jgi:hypothetical protein
MVKAAVEGSAVAVAASSRLCNLLDAYCRSSITGPVTGHVTQGFLLESGRGSTSLKRKLVNSGGPVVELAPR